MTVVPMDEHPRGPRGGWWTVTCNGIPVHHCAPNRRDLAERYATDPDYRMSLNISRFIGSVAKSRISAASAASFRSFSIDAL
jgi:hypothetical protein